MKSCVNIVVLALSLLAGNVMAATCTSVQSGDWNKDRVWNCNGQPAQGDSVIIANGTTVKADKNTNAVADITINPGGTLQGNPNDVITLTGNFTNNGTFDARGGTVAFTGTTQTITGNVTFANLTVSNGTMLTLAGNIVITGITNLTQSSLTSTCPTNYTITLANATVLNSCPGGGGGVTGTATASYSLDESAWNGTVGEVIDSMGNLNGTAINGTSTIAGGQVCRAGKFDGTNYVNIPNLSGLLNDTASLAFWVKTTQSGNNTDWLAPGVTGVELAGGTNDIFWGWLDASGHIGISTGNDSTSKSITAINNGVWHHVVLTRNASNGAYKIYIDGTLDKSGTIASGVIGTSYSSIGRIEDTGGTPAYFQGELDEIMIFNSVLSDTEVQTGYTNQAAGNNWDGSAHTCPGTGGPLSCVTFRDTFSTLSYSNNDGTANWTGNWVETGDDWNGAPDKGNIQISLNRLQYQGNSVLSGLLKDIFGNKAPYIQRGADLSPYTIATLTFDYADSGNLETNKDTFDIIGSADGGTTWAPIHTSSGNQTATTFTYDISALIANNFQLALSGKASRSNEYFYIDNVQIEACAVTTPTSFQITHDNFGINCVPEPIRVEAIASDGSTFAGYTGTITLDTGSGKGSWSLASGNGILTDLNPKDGLATYAFDLADNGIATFNLSYLEGASPITITAQEGAAVGSAIPLPFSPSGFTVTASALTDPTALPDNIGTQAAGSSFALYITAYGQTPTNATCGIIETYTGAKSLKFWSDYNNPATGTKQTSIDGSAVAVGEVTATAQPVTFTAGMAQVMGSYPDVGLITINMKDDTTADPNLPTGIRGGSNPFVVKPHHFSIANVQCSDGTANPAAADHTGSKFCAAGQSFSATVSALEAGGAITPNFGKETTAESVVLSAPSWSAASAYMAGAYVLPAVFNGFTYEATTGGTSSATEPTWPVINGATVVDGGVIWKAHAGYLPALVSPVAGINKPLVQSYTFNNGSASVTLSWPEVGIIQLTPHIQDGDYLGGGDVTATATGNVGRFYADHIAVTLSAATFTPADNTFTYMGQPFSYSTAPSLTITAMSAGNATLENYQGNYWMLGSNILPSGTSNVFQYGDNVGGTSTLASPASAIAFGDTTAVAGSLTLPVHSTGSFTYQRPAALIAPFDADVSLQISLQDSDGAAGSASLASIGFVGDSDVSPNPFNTTVDNMLRFGRAVLADTYGRETEAQRMYFNTHYYDGTDFVVNTDDLTSNYSVAPADPSTAPALTNPACSDPGTDAVACNQVSVGGTAVLPGSFFTLSAPGANNVGRLQYTLTVDPWLQFDWGSGTYTDNPFATATFGIFRGDDRFIYWREVE